MPTTDSEPQATLAPEGVESSPGGLLLISAVRNEAAHIEQVGFAVASQTLMPDRWLVSDDDIRSIGEETAGRPSKLDDLSKTVLRAAREMTGDLAMSDATFAALEKALGREQVIDLTLAIAFYNAVVRLLGTLQIDVEPEYQGYLEEHPLPR